MIKIALVEDDVKIAKLIRDGLQEQNFEVSMIHNGDEALQLFKTVYFDLIILDVMMPGVTGLEICKQLRNRQSDTPILMLTALGSIDDKVTGLNAGADDYLIKPFHFKELLARIEALLRRRRQDIDKKEIQLLQFEDVTLNLLSKEIYRGGIQIQLTAKEFTLLELFLRNPNRLLSRQYIAEKVWDISFDIGTNVIDVYINFLRKKIEKEFSRKLIHTIINMGYILK
ncbi:response regulator transcription factor [Pedobacter sp. JCM 36344]|uniref:response regulator transcription factor n=1 Tax=Pedobacter sp. JCM 36344 TaxID=3374280 RepID=UPI00397E473D